MRRLKIVCRLESEVRVERTAAGSNLRLGDAPPLSIDAEPHDEDAIIGLACEPMDLDEVTARSTVDSAGERESDFGLAIRRLREHMLVVFALWDGESEHALVRPTAPTFYPVRPRGRACAPALSRFAYLHRVDDCMVLQSPDTACLLVLHTPAAAAWFQAASCGGEATDAGAEAMADLLDRMGFTEDTDTPERADRAAWEFQDRLFHERTRMGESKRPFGATWRFSERFPSPPAIKAPMSDAMTPLDRPDLDSIESRPLLQLMESRRSIRRHGEHPIGRSQLAEFLFRCARVIERLPSPLQEGLRRPFPSGGAVHEIEFYLAIRMCDGVEPGLYHYHGEEHALYLLPSASPSLAQALVLDGGRAWGTPDILPQVVVILASRLPRLAWKAESTAYRTTMIDAGIIQQTLSLVATDMGLAGCPLGYGDSALFAAATGLDAYAETSVSEFALGAAPRPSRV